MQRTAMHQIALLYYFFQILFLRETIDNSISEHDGSAIFFWLIRTCMHKCNI